MKQLAAGLVLLAALGIRLAAAGSADPAETPVLFTPDEVRKILQHSPLPPPPPDPTNRVADNPAAARLGQRLFFDARLSANGKVSCATCHRPVLGWSNAQPVGQGLRTTRLHVPTLWNVAYNRWYFWDGRADTAWTQALEPLENPEEIGADRLGLLRRVTADPALRSAYQEAFGTVPDLSDPARFPEHAMPEPYHTEGRLHQAWTAMAPADRETVTRAFTHLGKAIAAYERLLVSRDAPFDRFAAGLRDGDPAKLAALTPSAQRGLRLFVGRGNCRTCHSGPNFTNGEFHSLGIPESDLFFETGRVRGIELFPLNPLTGVGRFSDDPNASPARFLPRDAHDTFNQMKTPTLRNIAQTAPYMHNGSFKTLDAVLRFYSDRHGARQIPPQDAAVLKPLELTPQEVADLTAFLQSLTGAPLDPSLTSPLP